jgi:hypothetical protein
MKKQFLGSGQVYLFRGIAVFYCPKKTRSIGYKRCVFSPVSIFRHTLWLLFIRDQVWVVLEFVQGALDVFNRLLAHMCIT